MAEIDTSGWTPIGATSNTDCYLIAPRIMAVVPHEGSSDTGATARENQDFQQDYFRDHGGAGVTIIFFDRMKSQDRDARQIYAHGSDPTLMLGAALVGGTALARAIGSFFLGLSRPRIPLKMFGDLDRALAWAQTLLDAHPVQEAE